MFLEKCIVPCHFKLSVIARERSDRGNPRPPTLKLRRTGVGAARDFIR